ncbi:hypothetical protein STCU_04104 [Strigomonas culicis]|uniref:Uncharacterized protein n=1 Tax=Strigomonas culicis TaxID=28005 RepID=S9UHR5_9TRYP|nr:hypothetical protein STCU_04104 [Strigomonas culicis]|eukprot:EPY30362.1 hypothetical protein STCU_04104 [Strigomonas culicis]
MLNVENYETIASLSRLARDVDLPRCCVRCVVDRVIPTRACEFSEGQVCSVIANIAGDGAGPAPAGEAVPLRVHFYDRWAYGASFVEAGDTLVLTGIQVHPVPPPGDASFYVTPLSEGGSLRVVQQGHADLLEVTVTPASFDNPVVKVLRANVGAAKNCYVNRRS